jgi:hypothetical protein
VAIIYVDNSERGAGTGYFGIGEMTGSSSYQSGVVRTGAYALQANPAGAATGCLNAGQLNLNAVRQGMSRTFQEAGPTNTVYTRFYFYWATKPAANDEEIYRMNNSAGQASLRLLLRSTGDLELLDVTGASLGTTAVLTAATWYRIEVEANVGAAAAYELRIDGITILSGTANQGGSNFFFNSFGKFANRNGQTIDVYYDDMLVDDAVFPGPGRIINLRPDANGTFSAWTAGTGASDFNEIDEIPPDDDTSYIANTAVASTISTFNFQSAATGGITGAIQAVCPWLTLRDIVAGGPRTRFKVISGATTDDAFAMTTSGVTTGYLSFFNIMLLDPDTGLPWTIAALNAIQAGVENLNTDITRVTNFGLFVAFNDEDGQRVPLLPLLGAG